MRFAISQDGKDACFKSPKTQDTRLAIGPYYKILPDIPLNFLMVKKLV